MRVRFEVRYAGLVILAALVAFFSIGCDALDPAASRPATTAAAGHTTPDRSETAPVAEASSASSTTPSMESIGPGSAMRVYYQFVDDRGGVQFVERLDAVPEAWRSRVGYVEMDRPPPLSPAAARESWKVSETRAQEILLAKHSSGGGGRRMNDFQRGGDVVLYSATWCGYCTQARAHLDRAGVDYELRDVDNGGVARELKEKTGRGGVPVLDFDGEILRGYSAPRYDEVIRAIGS